MRPGWPSITGAGAVPGDPEVRRAWTADPRRFYAVVLLLHSAAVEARRQRVARALHPWCAATTPGQAHITLAACGSVPPRPGLPTGRPGIVVGGADSFDAAAFLAVAGGSQLLGLRERVLEHVEEVDPRPCWVPHVTVGTYRWALPRELVAQRLASLAALPPLRTAGRLAVVSVHRRSSPGRLVEGPFDGRSGVL